jgi:hypothetical protein
MCGGVHRLALENLERTGRGFQLCGINDDEGIGVLYRTGQSEGECAAVE